jgi:hypothetical protein
MARWSSGAVAAPRPPCPHLVAMTRRVLARHLRDGSGRSPRDPGNPRTHDANSRSALATMASTSSFQPWWSLGCLSRAMPWAARISAM